MFHHPAWAVGSYSSGPPADGTPQIKVNPTQVLGQMNHPVDTVHKSKKPYLNVLADLLGDLLALLVVDGLADRLGMWRAHLVPDGLALLLVRALLLLDEGALGDGDGPALGLHDQLALLLVLGLADLVGDPLAGPVKE